MSILCRIIIKAATRYHPAPNNAHNDTLQDYQADQADQNVDAELAQRNIQSECEQATATTMQLVPDSAQDVVAAAQDKDSTAIVLHEDKDYFYSSAPRRIRTAPTPRTRPRRRTLRR